MSAKAVHYALFESNCGYGMWYEEDLQHQPQESPHATEGSYLMFGRPQFPRQLQRSLQRTEICHSNIPPH